MRYTHNVMNTGIPEKTAVYVRVSGRVQGVGFRYSTAREAERLGVAGWVKNAADGSVEVWGEGAPDKLRVFLQWLRKGPPFSRVDSLDTREESRKDYGGFTVEY